MESSPPGEPENRRAEPDCEQPSRAVHKSGVPVAVFLFLAKEFEDSPKLTPLRDDQVALLVNRGAVR